MALSKVNYVDNQTIITAQNLNDIQNEIIQNTELIKNIAPRNLLDNSDFRDPVNHLGIISGTEVKPYASFIDRWRNGEESSITPNLSSNGIQPNGVIFQILDLSAYISKKMTLATGFSDGNVVIASGTLTEASAEQELQLIFGTMEIGIATQGGMWLAGINYPNKIIQWAALYEGEYTAETLPRYQSKGYENELLVCRQYDPITDEYIGLRKFGQPRNLLDNSDFRNPVNQRGQTNYSLSAWGGYCIDRWAAYETGANITIGSGGLTLSGGIYQPISSDVISMYNGKVLTLAVKIAGTVYCCSGEVNQIGAWHSSARVDTPYGHIRFETEDNNMMFVIIDNRTTPSAVEWVALYEGEYTAETMPEYKPKGYGAELAECMRYFQYLKKPNTRITTAGFISSNSANLYFTIPSHPMRISSPTILSENLIGSIRNQNGYLINSELIGDKICLHGQGINTGYCAVYIILKNTLSNNTTVSIELRDTAEIVLDANL